MQNWATLMWSQQTAVNSHLADERNQIVEEWSKDEEEKQVGLWLFGLELI
jgi:hypothetical protein